MQICEGGGGGEEKHRGFLGAYLKEFFHFAADGGGEVSTGDELLLAGRQHGSAHGVLSDSSSE